MEKKEPNEPKKSNEYINIKPYSHKYSFFNYQFNNIDDINRVFFSNRCYFFRKIAKNYPEEGQKFVSVIDHLRNLYNKRTELFPGEKIQKLKTGTNDQIILTRKQVALLFLLSFLDLLYVEEKKNMNLFEVSDLLCKKTDTAFEFGRSFLNYLIVIGNWISENNPILDEKIIYIRRNINSKEYLKKQENIQLCDLVVDSKESLFNGTASYCVDFANKYIGGGVLTGGCVQEEILFCVEPEAIVSLLFMEVMDDNDAIGIYNTIQYSDYKGYGFKFTYNGCLIKDNSQKKTHRIIAIDAIAVSHSSSYIKGNSFLNDIKILNRDIHKAYVGFSLANLDKNLSKTIATGNWGCGVFGGNHELKFIQQWIAASFAGVERLDYYTFGDKQAKPIEKYYKAIKEKYKTAQNLYDALILVSTVNENYINNLLTLE